MMNIKNIHIHTVVGTVVLIILTLFISNTAYNWAHESRSAFIVKSETPLISHSIAQPQLTARSVYAEWFDGNGVHIPLVAKQSEVPLPIASITKLMTGLLAHSIFSSDQIIPITEYAITGKGPSGEFEVGTSFTAENLKRAMMVESNNDAARAISHSYGENIFIQKMNDTARELGFISMSFVNESGLDPYDTSAPTNDASTKDLTHLIETVYNKAPELMKYSLYETYAIVRSDGSVNHIAKTTDELLNDPEMPFQIIGGKTGETPRAKQNLVLIMKGPEGKGYIVCAILGSDDRFGEMKQILSWIRDSITWQVEVPAQE